MKLRKLFTTLPAVLLAEGQVAADERVASFLDGERVCFLGDSITHVGYYHVYIQIFYQTRFPDHRIHFFNCGLGGDTASSAFPRLDCDVLAHDPTSVSIMLGMNDVGRQHFCQEGVGVEEVNEENRNRYKDYTDMIVGKLKEGKPDLKVILILPSPYDQTAEVERVNMFGKGSAIARLIPHIKEIAHKYDAAVVDFSTPMLEINAAEQKKDTAFSIIGPDRVHPGKMGHMVMAYLFLKAQGLEGLVSEVKLDSKNNMSPEVSNCEISQLAWSPERISFDYTSNALPYPVDEDTLKKDGKSASDALGLVPFEDEFNRELFQVTNLSSGNYTLSIDGVNAGEYTAAQLTRGINLAANPDTPQYRQSRKILQLNRELFNQTALLRHVAWIEGRALLSEGVDLLDDVACAKALEKWIRSPERKPGQKQRYEMYKRYKSTEKRDAIKAKIRDIEDTIYTENHPHSHHYILRKKGA